MAQAFPLAWPEGWKRTHPNARQVNRRYLVTPDRASKHLLHELHLFGASSIIISSNVPVKVDGSPYANQKSPDDPGVAVYWSTSQYKDRVIACDKWSELYQNLHALGLAVAAMRAIERAGATQVMERAFSSFGALPAAPDAIPVRSWWEVFGFPETVIPHLTAGMIDGRYRELAAKAHPDRGGSDAAMNELNAAREQAKKHVG